MRRKKQKFTALERLIEYYDDNMAQVGRKLKTTRQNVSRWKRDGIPEKYALKIDRLTKGYVSMVDVLNSKK